MSSSYRISLDDWLKELDVKADRVLDIGGSQLPIKGRTKSWDVKDYLIADLPEPHIGSPKPDISMDMNTEFIVNFDCNPGNQILEQVKGRFDLVFCLETFDYVYDTRAAFGNIWNLLSEGGTAWVTFPTVYPTHNPIEDDALRYMEGGIRKLANASGLKVEEMIRRRPETNAIDNLWRAERMRAAKHYDHDFTGWIVRFTK